MNNKCYIKFLYSGNNPGENKLAIDMLDAGIDFAHAPISRNAILYIDGKSYHGLSKIREIVKSLCLENNKET